jgi:hypothetical protein
MLQWTDCDSDGDYWELASGTGDEEAAAEVVRDGDRWVWYVRLPPEWSNGRNPTGAAKTCDLAKYVCEIIFAGIRGE